MEPTIRPVILLSLVLGLACAAKRRPPPATATVPTAVPVRGSVPLSAEERWAVLQHLPHTEHESFMTRVADEDPGIASALVARVVREGVPACTELVVVHEEPTWYEYEFPSEDLSDNATLQDPCVGLYFVDDFAQAYRTDQDRRAIADELVGILEEDPGAQDYLWETVAELVPVADAPEAWGSVGSRAPSDPTDSDDDLEVRVWKHIDSAPPEARRIACKYAAEERLSAAPAMRGAQCLAQLGDDSALPDHRPGQSLDEVAFMLHMLAFDGSPTATKRASHFAAPGGVRILEGTIGETATTLREVASPEDFADWLPWDDKYLPSSDVSGPDCTPGPPATCSIRRREAEIERTRFEVVVRFKRSPHGSWVVTEVARLYDPMAIE